MVFYINQISTDFLIWILIFVVTFAISTKALKKAMRGSRSSIIAAATIALMVSYLASYNEFSIIKKIYTFGGISITVLIPAIIVFFFIYSTNINSLLRKVSWIFYGAITTKLLTEYNGPKILITITILATIIIILLDKSIKNIFNTNKNLKFPNK